MNDVEQVAAATQKMLGPDVSVDHIDVSLIEEYEKCLQDGTAEEVDASSNADVSPEARTRVLFGNHPAFLGTDFMFKSNGAGQPCGSGFVLHATGWQSIQQDRVENCPGHFPGYKFTFTYRA